MQQRYHALDNLRGIIMWLGVVIHVACNHMASPNLMPWRDSQTSQQADLIVIFIHTFRMPLFFILAGFAVGLLLQRSGARGMLDNRMRRLAIPFALFWPPLLVGMTILGSMFLSQMTHGYISLDLSLRPEDSPLPLVNTMHLWFLYYLICFCLLAAGAQPLLERIPALRRQAIGERLANLSSSGWGVIILTLPLMAVGSFYEFGFLAPDCSLLPNILELIHNGLYFSFGWLFFTYRDKLMDHYQRRCWRYVAAGGLLFMLLPVEFAMLEQGKLNPDYQPALTAFTYNIIGWLWSFALIGLFVRYFQHSNRVLRYLAGSSYWVYLTHPLGTIGFGVLLYDASLGLAAKMLVNIALTSGACLLSYHLLVRSSWLGRLLNGPRQPSNSTKPHATETIIS